MCPTCPLLSFVSLSSLRLYIGNTMTLEGEAKTGLILKTELAAFLPYFLLSLLPPFPQNKITAQFHFSVASQVPAGNDIPIGLYRLTFTWGWYCDVQVVCRPSAVSRLEMCVDKYNSVKHGEAALNSNRLA